ncbi:FtsX-like permease family protein [Imperialibacter roseus]|uniref:FtsX-like permease family protein n=1 Tax=Imperialibacter roseus TaxID=1324217 RepID=A0ABZ0IHI6_9BACT|nr:ABC transporter permease [Imperialibacter roseus]WOK04504.1 FtsX-like permease family protein [Imperialibacter roseus]
MNKSTQPPKLPLLFFRWFCHPDYREDIEGDLTERFEMRVEEKGAFAAKALFWLEVLKLLRPDIVRPFEGAKRLDHYGMLKNHIKITLRYLKSHKAFTFINLVGLTTGILVCFFALLFVEFELSYDKYHENSEHIYRLVTDVQTPNGARLESSAPPMAPAVTANFPAVTDYARVFLDYMIVQSDPETFMREDLAYADASVFSVFTLPLVASNSATVLDAPYDAVLSETAAVKYFGTTDCLGKQLTLDGSTNVYVVGVMKDMPYNSHFRTDIFLSMKLLTEVWNPGIKSNWHAFGTYTYLLLQNKPNIASLNKELTSFVAQHVDAEKGSYSISIEPLTELYLHAEARGFRTGSSVTGSINNVYILAIVALLVLSIAGFNFVNLSTALSLNRAKEISVRKVLGAAKRQLLFQFLADAVFLSLVAFTLALAMFVLFSPFFNQLVGKPISTNIFNHLGFVGSLLALTMGVGLLAGIYPAFFLSGFDPVSGLKGKVKSGSHGHSIRKSLVVAQFFFSVMLIASTLGVYRQLHFMQNKDLGYSKDQKLVLDFYFDENIRDNEKTVKQELLAVPGVTAVSMSSCVPGNIDRRYNLLIPGADGNITSYVSDFYRVDFDFINQYKMEIVAGRGFQEELQSDITGAVILNETAARTLGYSSPAEVVGKSFEQQNRYKGTVIGVVKDFHFKSLKEKITPLALQIDPSRYTLLTLDVSGNNMHDVVDRLEDKWVDFGPKRPFSYYFADQAYQAQYQAEDHFGKLVLIFASIALMLSVLGLLGLSALDTQQRAKEIGIRKILGASPSSLLGLLSKDFLLLVLVASALAVPVSFFGLSSWLEGFAYRIDVAWWLFAIATSVVVILSVVIIASQVVKAALANPIHALRDE